MPAGVQYAPDIADEDVAGWPDASPDVMGLEGADHQIVTPSLVGDKQYVVRAARESDLDGLERLLAAAGERRVGRADLALQLRHVGHPNEFVVWHEKTDASTGDHDFMGFIVQHMHERQNPQELDDGEEITGKMVFFAHWVRHPDYQPIRDNVLKAVQRMPFHQTWSCKMNVGVNAPDISLKVSRFDKTPQKTLTPWYKVTAETLFEYRAEPPFKLERVKEDELIVDMRIEALTEANVHDVLEYDEKLFKLYDRHDFLFDWFDLGDGRSCRSIVAYDDIENEVVGYASLRDHGHALTVEPLYADYPEVAVTLLVELLRQANELDKAVYLCAHPTSHNKLFSDFLELTLKMAKKPQLRQYTIQSVEMDWKKTFALHRDFHM